MRIIAHRGASQSAPENTMPAFHLARAQGADALEIDVQPTLDRKVVVFHDWTLNRLCGTSLTVRRTPLAMLASHTVSGEPIPTLDDVLRDADRPDDLVIELKSRVWNDVLVAALTAKAIRRTGALERGRITVSSFNPFCLMTIWRIAPDIPRALLAHRRLALPLRRLWGRRLAGASELHLKHDMVTEELTRWARSTGRTVCGWTVNDGETAQRLVECGVDGLITDAPAAIREAIGSAADVEKPVPQSG
ncbi:glycerophosphodiester phosphodiesterase [Planctomycetota bacterium]